MTMYNPCAECLNRYGHDYGSECDDKCLYAKSLKAEPCEDAVSREAVLEIAAETGALETQTRVKALPPVTPKPKTGKWMKTGQSFINPNRFRNYCCSECGWELDEHIRIEPHYCPNCGAKMEGESE